MKLLDGDSIGVYQRCVLKKIYRTDIGSGNVLDYLRTIEERQQIS
jgi:hypothetical protein